MYPPNTQLNKYKGIRKKGQKYFGLRFYVVEIFRRSVLAQSPCSVHLALALSTSCRGLFSLSRVLFLGLEP